jgi:hypothetical protein
MNKFLAVLLAAFLAVLVGQASATTRYFPSQSIDSLNSSLVCDKENKKEKKKQKFDDIPEEEEPECD